MKRKLTQNGMVCLLVLVAVLVLSTCKKDGIGTLNITGTWYTLPYNSKTIVNQYQFKSDSTFEFTTYKIDSISKKTIGYESKLTGNYNLNKNTLNFTGLQYFVNPTYAFGPASLLTPIDGPVTETYTIALNYPKNQLWFYFICPINADCVPSPIIYHKR